MSDERILGIVAGQQSRILDRFYQVNGSLRRQYEGSGLGLAVIKEIAASHEGTIGVESRPGEGNTFRRSLPAMAPAEEQAHA